MDLKLNNSLPDISLSEKRLESYKNAVSNKGKKDLTVEDKAGYAKASRGFESLFVHMMIKEMKKSMLENKEDDGAFGADTLGGYADMMLAEQISKNGIGIGIADKLYNQITGDHLSPTVIQYAEKDAIAKKPVEQAAPAAKKVNIPIREGSDAATIKFSEKMQQRLTGYDDIISEASKKYVVPEHLIKAIITAESAGKANARSSAGAKGLMQLMDGTARSLGVKNSFDPYENIMGGTKYIRMMLDRFDGDMEMALAAYNAGPGNVEKYDGIPPFRETQAYVERVKRYNQTFKNEA